MKLDTVYELTDTHGVGVGPISMGPAEKVGDLTVITGTASVCLVERDGPDQPWRPVDEGAE